MSVRQIRLCDCESFSTGGAGGGGKRATCEERYVATCPLCDVDCCRTHFGENCFITVQFNVKESTNSSYNLGSQRIDICRACSDRLPKLQGSLNGLARDIPLVEPVRGILTAQTLSTEKK